MKPQVEREKPKHDTKYKQEIGYMKYIDLTIKYLLDIMKQDSNHE